MWGRFGAGSFHSILPTTSVGLDRFLNQTAQNTGFSATTNGCDSSRSKVKWWEIANALTDTRTSTNYVGFVSWRRVRSVSARYVKANNLGRKRSFCAHTSICLYNS